LACCWPAHADTQVAGPVGPAETAPSGRLVVYTATVPSLNEAGARFDWANNYNLHTDYTVYRPNRSVFLKVRNSFGPYDENAKTVSLPAGRYTIRAKSEHDGWVLVSILIKPGRLTTVKLADSIDSPHQRNIPASQAIRTPSGEVVGWFE
jgi:hypothetical protein